MALRDDVITNVSGYLVDTDLQMMGVLADRAIAAFAEYGWNFQFYNILKMMCLA